MIPILMCRSSRDRSFCVLSRTIDPGGGRPAATTAGAPGGVCPARPREHRAAMPSLNHERMGSGEPLVLLHGIGGELCVWEPVLDALAREHEVIAVDLPGFGRSPALPGGVVPTPAALAGAVAELLDELGVGTAHVCGNSLGGWVALELARSGRARSVLGLCPAGLWRAPLIRPGVEPPPGRAHRLARRWRALIPVAMLVPRIRHTVLAPFVADPSKVPYHAAWRMVRSYARATAYDATSTAMRRGHLRDPQEIAAPVTLAFGERDRLIRPVRTAIPGAQVKVLPGCGHVPMWDDTELVAETILVAAARGARTSAPAAAAR
jgi:pimeloyl-ACP methyl ester carboxylesterase